MMRKILTSLLLLGTIVLFTAAGGNRGPMKDGGGSPDPGCLPCISM